MKLSSSLVCATALAFASTITVVDAHATALVLGPVTPASAGTMIGNFITGTVTPVGVSGDGTPFTANYVEAVYRSGITAVCPTGGCIDFAFAFNNTSSGTDPIEHMTDTNFTGYNVAVGYVPGSTSQDPTSATIVSGVVNFNFANGILPGQGTDELIIYTNATNYSVGSMSFQDGTTATVAGLMPAAAVTPEPSSLILLGTGLAGLAGAARRKIRG